MRKAIITLLVCSLAISCKTYDVYLLIGQSNMAGRGYLSASDTTTTLDGVYLLNGQDKPEAARHPLNRYSSIRKSLKMQEVGPGGSFGEDMHKKTNRKILLVVNAKGGSSIREWENEDLFYKEAVRRGKEALKFGKMKGILWLQGCSDASRRQLADYPGRLATLASSLRKDLGVKEEDVRFVAGQIPHWDKRFAEFNTMIKDIGKWIPNSDWVSTEGLKERKNKKDPHFSRESQMILGKRFAEKFEGR